jgi:hypothetical protein
MRQIEASLKREIHRVEVSLKQEIHGVRTAIAETKFEMIRWLFIFWVGQVAATVSVIKLLRQEGRLSLGLQAGTPALPCLRHEHETADPD